MNRYTSLGLFETDEGDQGKGVRGVTASDPCEARGVSPPDAPLKPDTPPVEGLPPGTAGVPAAVLRPSSKPPVLDVLLLPTVGVPTALPGRSSARAPAAARGEGGGTSEPRPRGVWRVGDGERGAALLRRPAVTPAPVRAGVTATPPLLRGGMPPSPTCRPPGARRPPGCSAGPPERALKALPPVARRPPPVPPPRIALFGLALPPRRLGVVGRGCTSMPTPLPLPPVSTQSSPSPPGPPRPALAPSVKPGCAEAPSAAVAPVPAPTAGPRPPRSGDLESVSPGSGGFTPGSASGFSAFAHRT